jgi:hypothetical protein
MVMATTHLGVGMEFSGDSTYQGFCLRSMTGTVQSRAILPEVSSNEYYHRAAERPEPLSDQREWLRIEECTLQQDLAELLHPLSNSTW